jgi:hypothetical protein
MYILEVKKLKRRSKPVCNFLNITLWDKEE